MTTEAQQQSDEHVVAAVRNKDRKATAEFLSRYGGPVHGYLSRRLLPKQDVRAWLLGIARHKVQDHYWGL